MKVFLEADFAKGSGAIRWEGVTRRWLRGAIGLVVTMAAATAFFVLSRI